MRPRPSTRSSRSSVHAEGALREIDLASLDLALGAAVEVVARVPVDPLRLSGQDYVSIPAEPEVRVQVTRAMSGWHLRLRAGCELVGPCWRCLVAARYSSELDTQEFQANGRAGEEFDENLDSTYVEGKRLDLETWLRDAIVESLPDQLVCREGCKGLCAICGADLNLAPCGCDAPPPGSTRPFSGLTERLTGGTDVA